MLRTSNGSPLAASVRTFAIAAALSLLVTACGGSGGNTGQSILLQQPPAAKGDLDSIVWGLYRTPLTLDPVAVDLAGGQVLPNLCDSLFRLNPDFSQTPAIATSVQHPDPTTYVFNIRPDVKFWDGSTLTADDVAFSLQRNQNPKLRPAYARYFKNVTSIEVVGPNQVKVALSKPDVLFRQAMTSAAAAVVEKQFVLQKGATYGSPAGGVMCTGPYKVATWISGDSLTMVRNDSYWDPAVKPHIRNFKFKFLPDESLGTNALLKGEVLGMYTPPYSGAAQLKSTKDGAFYTNQGDHVISLSIADINRGPLKDPRIRRAVALALDRQSITDGIFFTGGPAKALVGPTVWGYAADTFSAAYAKLPDLKQNITEAKRLVQEAGSPTEPIVVLSVTGALVTYASLSQVVVSSLKSIGLNAQLKPVTVPEFGAAYNRSSAIHREVDLIMRAEPVQLADPLSIYSLFASPDDASNLAFYANSQVGDLVSQALATEDPANRAKIVVKIQSQVMQDLPYIPVVDTGTTLYLNKQLAGPPVSLAILSYHWATLVGKA